MHSDGRNFKSTPSTFARTQPFVGGSLPSNHRQGLFVGRNRETRRAVFIDGYAGRKTGLLNGLYALVDGERESGKSTFLKCMILRSGSLQAGLDQFGYPNLYRMQLFESRNEAGAPEYEPVTKNMGGVTISPVQQKIKLNPYDPSASDEASMLRDSVDLAEIIQGAPLTGLAPFVHQLAVRKMLRELPGLGSPQLYAQVLATTTGEDGNQYFKENADDLRKNLKTAADSNPQLAAKLHNLLDLRTRLDEEELAREVTRQAAIMSQLTNGEYGVLFSGDGTPFSEILGLPFVSIDRLGMSPKLRVMFDSQYWNKQTWAITHNQKEHIPHASFGDEDQDNYLFPAYLRAFDEYIRKIRSFHTWVWRATQYSSRLTKIGEASSEARELAQTIDLGVSIRCVFRQPENDDVLHHLTQLGFTDKEAAESTHYPQGCFALLVGKLPPIFVEHYVTEPEKPLIKTNLANDAMLERRNAREFEPRSSSDEGLQIIGPGGEFIEA